MNYPKDILTQSRKNAKRNGRMGKNEHHAKALSRKEITDQQQQKSVKMAAGSG
jgi:hypothetical protein